VGARGAVAGNENQLGPKKKKKMADKQKSVKRTFSAFGSSPTQDEGNLEDYLCHCTFYLRIGL
jgi:hypothetical protein